MGLIGCLLVAPYFPGRLVLLAPERFLARPASWLRAISRHRATISPAPNFAYSLVAERVLDSELEGVDLSSWRCALSGAEPVSARTLDHFASRFGRFGFDPRSLMPVYGLSEAALAVTFPAPGRLSRVLDVDEQRLAAEGVVEPGARSIVGVGAPVPGVCVELRNEHGQVVPSGRQGRIFVRSPSLMREYFGDPLATREVLTDGWLDTGDLGFVDDGELYISGRAKDVIVIRGANHCANVFEECLDEVQGVRQGCAVALGFIPDGEEEEQLLILAERAKANGTTDDDAVVAEIRRVIAARTGILPREVRMLTRGTLPRTSSGKLRRGEALRRFTASELHPPHPVSIMHIVQMLARSSLSLLRLRIRRHIESVAEPTR
jgi:acyl-CoA synthetase (AMP-forming)/AMP-acid ligase II